jgi:hypothetical protein
MIILITILFFVVSIIFFVLADKSSEKHIAARNIECRAVKSPFVGHYCPKASGDGGGELGTKGGIQVTFAIILLACFIINLGICCYTAFTEQAKYIELQAFHDNNYQVYAKTIQMNMALLSTESSGKFIDGSIEKTQQSTNVNKEIAEWRRVVVEYNQVLAQKQYWAKDWYYGILFPARYQNLKPIIIE